MSGTTVFAELLAAAGFDGNRAALRVRARYEPVGGPGSRVFPPTYPPQAGSSTPYLFERRWVDGRERPDVVLDAVPSEANRAEEALLRAYRRLEMPQKAAVVLVVRSMAGPEPVVDALPAKQVGKRKG